jgi:quercetin dioxygenase-like cupin family protein
MKKKLALVAAVLSGATLVAVRLASSQAKEENLDPIVVAGDTHKLAFENEFVRILDVHVPPGSIEKRHRHPHGMSVYFTDWTVKATVDGKAPEVHERKAGTFAWSEAVVHQVENVGKTEGHILRIELKF